MLHLRALDRTERVKAALLGCWFFVTVATLWLLKSVRVASLLAHLGARETPYVRLVGVGAVAVTVMFYSIAVKRLSRVNIVRAANGAFAAALVVYWLAMRLGGTALGSQRWFVWAIYVLVDVYTVVVIEIFWTYANDVVTQGEANRLYGVVGLGGIIGGMAGGVFVDLFSHDVGQANLLLVAAAMLVVAAALGSVTERVLQPPPRTVIPTARLASALEGVQEVKTSRYLLLIVGMVVAYEFTATLADFSVNVVFENAHLSEPELTKMYGRLGWIASGTAALAQVALVPLLLPSKRVALLVPPLAMLASVTAFVLATVDRGLNYSIQQSTRESLYIPLKDSQKYNAKAFIDMFVDRAAKAAASLVLLVIIALSTELTRPALLLSCLSMLVWIASARRLGRYSRLPPPSAAPAPSQSPPRTPSTRRQARC
jgi:AAA family ATP:ADP antiporter